MNLADLKSEIENDPLDRGYAGMSDVEVADSLNERTREADADALHGGDLVAALDQAEWEQLGSGQKQYLQLIVSAGSSPLTAAIRNSLREMFPTQSQTRRNLLRLMRQEASRGMELGLGRNITPSDVANARRL